jgi:uncharacterized protein YecE (DUF72 family)
MPEKSLDKPAKKACGLWIGTSGYSYAEWVAAGFYPAGTPSGRMLPVYARTFAITELNYTWYQMPKADVVARMGRRVSERFRFTAKLNRTLTHEIDADMWRARVNQYRDGVAPLLQSKQLMAILLQLGPTFHYTPANRRYLAALLDELVDMPVAVEFRHVSWAKDSVFKELERRRVTLVAVDEPELPGLFPKLDVVTNPELFYVRFHGRNTKGWRSGNMQKQFDYNYSDEELQEWIETYIGKMVERAGSGVLFFNNHVRAQATENAGRLIRRLTERGMQVETV